MSEGAGKAQEKRKIQAIKGVRDILPPETALWNRVEQTAHEVFATYGFGEIRLPIFETTELFARSIGVDTDVVEKEMYSFKDYETADELYALYAAVISASYPKTDEDLTHILTTVGGLISAVRNAFAQGRLPKTPENEKALDELVLYRATLTSLRHHYPNEINPIVNALKKVSGDLEFGDSLTPRPEAAI